VVLVFLSLWPTVMRSCTHCSYWSCYSSRWCCEAHPSKHCNTSKITVSLGETRPAASLHQLRTVQERSTVWLGETRPAASLHRLRTVQERSPPPKQDAPCNSTKPKSPSERLHMALNTIAANHRQTNRTFLLVWIQPLHGKKARGQRCASHRLFVRNTRESSPRKRLTCLRAQHPQKKKAGDTHLPLRGQRIPRGNSQHQNSESQARQSPPFLKQALQSPQLSKARLLPPDAAPTPCSAVIAATCCVLHL
jgi:hypothetical protein